MRIVIALGGNALGNSPQEQQELAKMTARSIVDLIEQGNDVIVTHGNGPQVGMIHTAFDASSSTHRSIPKMPFPECGAMSQGYIGYHLQNAINNENRRRNIHRPVTTLVTQVVVDKDDPAFLHPTKPIGSFCTKEQADQMAAMFGYTMKEDAGRGYRRVVASPNPVDIVELDAIITLLNANHTIITVGGGGIPVYKDNDSYVGVDAVIDKDFASSKLADLIDADCLLILTAVPNVSIHFNTPKQATLSSVDVAALEQYIDEGHFAPGSMLPKVQAALRFVKQHPTKIAIIASLEEALMALEGKSGTRIYKK